MTALADEYVERLRGLGNADEAAAKARYLQAFPGGYGEGDEFVGVRVPQVRALARDIRRLAAVADVEALLCHPIHEARLLGAITLVGIYGSAKTSEESRQELIDVLLRRADHLDNWDLVDSVAPYTLGPWLVNRPRRQQDSTLDELAASPVVWRRRLAMVATLGMIREGELAQTFRLAAILIDDSHDLIHKAVGWMLREAGLRDRAALDAFLDRHAATMSRTALRAALEKHEPERRRAFLGRRT